MILQWYLVLADTHSMLSWLQAVLDRFGVRLHHVTLNSSTFTDLDPFPVRITWLFSRMTESRCLTSKFLEPSISDANQWPDRLLSSIAVVDASINDGGRFQPSMAASERLTSSASLWRMQIGLRYDFLAGFTVNPCWGALSPFLS
jgi:hypothetical protein